MSQSRSTGVVSLHQILSLYLPSMLLSLGTGLVAPVIPGFAKSFEVSLSMATLVFVSYSAGAVAATFPAGYLMDKIGRRPVLLAGMILMAVGSFMTPFSHSFAELLFWRFVVGAAWQLWQQARLAVIADTTRHRERARQMQWMMGVGRGGELFGPAVGGLLAAGFGVWVPFALHAVLTLLAVIPSFKLIQETAPGRRRREEGETEAVGDQSWRSLMSYFLTFQIITFLTIQCLAQLSRGGQEHGSLNLYAVYAYNIGPEVLGLMNTAAVIFGIPVPFLSGYLMDRFGRRSVIVPGFGSYGVALIMMSTTAFFQVPFGFFMATYVLVVASQGTIGGTMQVLGTDLSPPAARGRFFAVWRLIAQFAAMVSPAIFGVIAEHISYGVGFVYLAACAAAVAVGVGVVLGDTMAKADAAEREAAQEPSPRTSGA